MALIGYNLTQISDNSTGLLGLAQVVNTTLTDGIFGTLFLMGIAVILGIAFYQATDDPKKTMVGVGFVCFILATLMRTMNLVNDTTVFVTLLILAFSIAIAWKG